MKVCARKGCKQPPRPRGRFCSDLCRWEEWDRRHPRRDRTTARRASRDGLGAKVYLSDAEILALLHRWADTAPPADFYEIRDRAVRKLEAALDRIRRRK